jgi:Fe2+ transport system protein FeoA
MSEHVPIPSGARRKVAAALASASGFEIAFHFHLHRAAVTLSRPLAVPPQDLAAAEPIPLAELAPGERAVVLSVDTTTPIGRRPLALGFHPGTPLRVGRRAPLGDPTTYELRGSRFCLRRSEAERIRVGREASDAPIRPAVLR